MPCRQGAKLPFCTDSFTAASICSVLGVVWSWSFPGPSNSVLGIVWSGSILGPSLGVVWSWSVPGSLNTVLGVVWFRSEINT